MNDPVFSNPDCDSEASTPDRAVLNPPEDQVRVAELQVFGGPPPQTGASSGTRDCTLSRKGKCKGARP